MSFTNEEKMLVQEALQIYLQLVSRQMPPAQVQQIMRLAEGVVAKLDTAGAAGNKKGNKSPGITDEWYNNVCKKCDKLGPSGCTEKVTEKFPGKCDPILHYEQSKHKR